MPTETRPWGSFTNLYETPYAKVKTIEVQPKKRLSLQSHRHRSENWTVIHGTAIVQVDDNVYKLNPGESVFIPVGAKHRLANEEEGPLEIIEVQTGSYFGEDDIIRYEDDFNRLIS